MGESMQRFASYDSSQKEEGVQGPAGARGVKATLEKHAGPIKQAKDTPESIGGRKGGY